jgi:hypothetical protein
MFHFFQKETPEQLKAQAKANYEKVAALKSSSRESASVRVRIALLAKAHLDSAFVEGAERFGTWQELCMLAVARGEEKPEPPTPSYFHRVRTQGNEHYTYTWIPEELSEDVFNIGARYQTVQIDAHQAIAMVQRIADEICQKDLKLDAPFKALQFLRDELEAAGETVNIPAGGGAAALGLASSHEPDPNDAGQPDALDH